PTADFANVFHLMKYELLWHAFRRLKLNKAPGVDGVSVEDYEANLRDNLQDLASRLQRGAYRPQPSLRREIPKGNGKTRGLGIATRPAKRTFVQSAFGLGRNHSSVPSPI
ncbi:MAG: hypothetical protein WBD20_11365, partial [Pirellulaceae bacterium]